MQCPSCGRRFREPRCATHGALIPTGLEAGPIALPDVPGYKMLGVLGVGGFGSVFLAEGDQGKVAVKTAHRGQGMADARLRREASALHAIGPPHVPRLHQVGDLADGTSFIVIDFVPWSTLADRLADRAGLPVGEAVPIALGILSALVAAHARGLVHRDLKPENIFVDDGKAMLVDFGLVKQVGTAAGAEGLTVAGSIIGSTTYMSPEQAAARADIDERSDIYSLGVILYEMLAGRPPFIGTPSDVLQAHLSRRPPRLATLVEIPAQLDALVHACLAKRREERPASAAEIARTLEAIVGQPAGAAVGGVAPAPRARTTGPMKAVSPASLSREKRMAGMLFFRSPQGTASVQACVGSFGGQMARADGSFVAVFDHDAGENPAQRALLAARALIDRGVARSVVLETAQVTVMPRPDGGKRYLSALFTRDDRFPAPADPDGILLTHGSAELLPGFPLRPVDRDLLQLAGDRQATAAEARPAPFFGRDAERAQLLDAALEATRGMATIATISGGPGLGKSRLLEVALAELRRRSPEIEILALRAGEPLGGAAGGVLRELSRLVFGLSESRPADSGRGQLAERLGFALAEEVWPGVAVAMGWAAATDPDVRALAAAPGVLRSSVARAIGFGLRQRSLEHPLVLALDDAHFADAACLDAIELATLEEASAPILVCVAARPSFIEARPGWGARAARHLRIELAPLAGAAAADLCRKLLEPAENVPAATLDAMVARTQGNPQLLHELVRGLFREGLVRKSAKGEGWYLASDALGALPDLPLVEWLASRELAGLPPELARHARLLALLGPDFSLAEVHGVTGELDHAGLDAEFPLDAQVAVRRLLESGLLVDRGATRFAFRSGVVRDAIERATPPPLAMAVHEAAFELHADRDDLESLVARAYHAGKSGRHRESFGGYLELGRRAEAQHAYLEAEGFFTRALEHRGHGEAGEDAFDAVHGRGLMRYRLARYWDALPDLREARSLAAGSQDRRAEIATILDEATVLDWVEEWHRSRELAEDARGLAAALPDGPGPLVEARLAMALGRSACRFSDDAESARWLLDAARQAERLGDAGYETFVVALLLGGYELAMLGRMDEAEAAFDRVIPLVEARGDQLHLGAALGNRTILWTLRQQPERAIADLERVLLIAREIGNPKLESTGHQMLATSLHWIGRSEEAEAEARKAVEVDDHRFGASARLESRVILARILAVRGKLVECAQVLEAIRERQASARARGSRDADLVPSEESQRRLAELLVRGGTREDWRELEEKARASLTGYDLAEVMQLVEARGR